MATPKLNNCSGGYDEHASHEDIFNCLFKEHEKSLYERILPLCKCDHFAKDIIQDIFLKLWINRDILNEIHDIKAYLYTMAENRLFNLFKRAACDRKVKMAIWNKSKSSANVTEQQVLLKEWESLFEKAVNELPQQRRIVYKLHKEGYSYNEISESQGISKHTIKNQVYAAVKQIKKALTNYSPLLITFLWTFKK